MKSSIVSWKDIDCSMPWICTLKSLKDIYGDCPGGTWNTIIENMLETNVEEHFGNFK